MAGPKSLQTVGCNLGMHDGMPALLPGQMDMARLVIYGERSVHSTPFKFEYFVMPLLEISCHFARVP